MEFFKIADGISGLFVENHRFSTTHISVNMYLPLKKENIAANALLPYVLSSCTAKYPDFSSLNLRLCELYGADVGGIADKIGDTQVLRFFSFFINRELVPEDIDLPAQCCDLLFSMLFDPSLEGDSFKEKDVNREKRLTLEKIEGMINDKRSFAINRTLAEMYKGDAFGELKTGSYEAVKALTGEDVFKALKRALTEAEIRIQVIGKAVPEGLFERFADKLKTFSRVKSQIAPSKPKALGNEVCRITENMDVSQGKLVMGFVTDFVGNDEKTAPIAVFCDLFGGGPYSKLFSNVREKMSLCYYCAARANRSKGYILVDSGVESENADKAEKEILNQLEELKKGNFSDEDLASSLRSIKESLSCLNDSQSALDGWYSSKIFGTPLTPEEFAGLVDNVTKEDIIKVAGLYRLDTVYKIMPKEAK